MCYWISWIFKGGDNNNSILPRLLCGGLAGSSACVVCYPLDLVRTRLSVVGKYNGIIDALVKVALEEGPRGLYRGLSAALTVAVPQIAINYAAYGSIKAVFIREKHPLLHDSRTDKLTSIGSILGGAVSGIIASLCTFPADVLRRRMQMRGTTSITSTLSFSAEILDIYRYCRSSWNFIFI